MIRISYGFDCLHRIVVMATVCLLRVCVRMAAHAHYSVPESFNESVSQSVSLDHYIFCGLVFWFDEFTASRRLDSSIQKTKPQNNSYKYVTEYFKFIQVFCHRWPVQTNILGMGPGSYYTLLSFSKQENKTTNKAQF